MTVQNHKSVRCQKFEKARNFLQFLNEIIHVLCNRTFLKFWAYFEDFADMQYLIVINEPEVKPGDISNNAKIWHKDLTIYTWNSVREIFAWTGISPINFRISEYVYLSFRVVFFFEVK